MGLWRRLLIWILVLHTAHAPLPVPDLDGECRGIPITSLTDCHAWHPVLLGIRPNDDVDRGPIRTPCERESCFDGSQFGDLAICAARPAHVAPPMACMLLGHSTPPQLTPLLATTVQSGTCSRWRRCVSSRTVSIDFCVWLI